MLEMHIGAETFARTLTEEFVTEAAHVTRTEESIRR